MASDSSLDDKPTKIAWMGGSFSPPTVAHSNVAMEIGKKLREMYPAERCRVCIVPVSHGYNKPSININCVQPDARVGLVEAMVEGLNAEKNDDNLDFIMETHELQSTTAVATIDSLSTLKTKYPGATIFISQGQDNIEAIFQRKWTRSNELIENYGFIMYPRGGSDKEVLKTVDVQLAQALKDDSTTSV
jgi:nicotinic acid mononucleotide adenylyltransferase